MNNSAEREVSARYWLCEHNSKNAAAAIEKAEQWGSNKTSAWRTVREESFTHRKGSEHCTTAALGA